MRMPTVRAAVTAAACAAALALSATACQQQPRTDEEPGRPSAAPAALDTTFLARGECSSRGRADFREVSCGSERAVAKVTARHDGRKADGPRCPAYTDFVLHITERLPDADEDGDGSVPRGYACMRNLEPPHPGDPGGGGGPRTVVGDCVYTARQGEVREAPCDGSGEHAPGFRVASTAAVRADCPSDTTLFVGLDGREPVGCARAIG